MKLLLLLCLLAIAKSQEWDIEIESELYSLDDEYIPEAPIDIIKGLLDGFGIKEDIEALKKCAKNLGPIVEELKNAANILIHINIKKVKELKEALKKLIGAAKKLANLLAPCAKEGSAVMKLIKLIKNCNIASILVNALKNIPKIIEGAKEIISGVQSKNDYKIGHGLGVILRAILL